MSLAIVFKGPEGLALAVDSRVTLTVQLPGQNVVIPSTFDNATKLLQIQGQTHIGVVTYGLGALGQRQPRTAHSFIPEFEHDLSKAAMQDRLQVQPFAERLSAFFMRQWDIQGMPSPVAPGGDMVFLVAGYDPDATYGRVFECHIPSQPVPLEWHKDDFGMIWGGQRDIPDRLITGFDVRLPHMIQEFLHLTDEQRGAVDQYLKSQLQAGIPFPFLPLQDGVDLAIFLLRTAITLQTFLVGTRSVGGAIDAAIITKTEGLKVIQAKEIAGEKRGA